jgi:1-phosphatidylinositol-4-phosphate 5-kinase
MTVQLVVDSTFLCDEFGTMDYSLLVGIHKETLSLNVPEIESSLSACAAHVPVLYFFGIIDFLQTWTLRKQLEMWFKVYIWRQNPDGISAIPPRKYRERFQRNLPNILNYVDASGATPSYRHDHFE